jgi:hypothetical protein
MSIEPLEFAILVIGIFALLIVVNHLRGRRQKP